MLATRADTGEVLHARLRKGSAQSQRGAERFVRELVQRLRRLGASGPLLVRADSGFWCYKTIAALGSTACATRSASADSRASAGDRADPRGELAGVEGYPPEGIAEIAESTLSGRRLVVRRTRLVGAQAELFPDWRYHAFITNRREPLALVEADHRRHALIELAIRDLKDGAGLDHAPSGRFFANGAWLVIGSVAHNLARWVARIGPQGERPDGGQDAAPQLLTLPGRITRGGRRATLHLPARWPWRESFTLALERLRAIPLLA